MIEEKRLTCWAEFKDEIASIRDRYGHHQVQVPEDIELAKGVELGPDRVYERKNNILFRGQSDASWPIQTTLERKTASHPIHVHQYMVYADYCVNEIESLTGRSWNVPIYREMDEEIRRVQDAFRVHLPAYDYLVYLRQHGFPSPLLDWTESPYVAAFFAFWAGPPYHDVAVFSYLESRVGGRWLKSPKISVQGPYVTTDARHFAQKTWYTVATRWEENEKHHYFCSHDDVFQENDPEHDILIKMVLPKSLRTDAIRELVSDYNITPFTLFQTEDALIKTMELKQFDLDDILGDG